MTIHKRFYFQQGLMWGNFGLILPILTLYLLHNQFSLFEIALYAAIFSGSTALCELPSAFLAESWGRLRAYRFSLLLNVLACILMVLIDEKWGGLLAAFFFGVAKACNSGSIDAWYVNILKSRGQDESIAYHLAQAEFSAALGLACFSLLGGVLPDLVGLALFNNPYKVGFVLSGILFFLLFLLTPYLSYESDILVPSQSTHTLLGDLREIIFLSWSKGNLRTLLILFMLLGGIIATFESYWPVIFNQLLSHEDKSTWSFGLLLTLLMICKGIGGWLSFGVLKMLSKNQDIAVSFPLFFLAMGLFLITKSDNVVSFSSMLMITIVFFGLVGAVINTLLHQNVSNEMRTRAISTFSLFFQIGSVFSSLVLGFLVERLGILQVWSGFSLFILFFVFYSLFNFKTT